MTTMRIEWILAEERPPEDGRQLLVCDDRGMYLVASVFHRRAGCEGIYTPAYYGVGARVLYWAYIPEPEMEMQP